MTSWPETSLVLTRLAEVHSAGRQCALATVIRVRGSAYRRPGAKLLVEEDGHITGNVSGGCLELDVREVALRVIATGIAERRSYCSAAGDDVGAWDLGVGCEGEVEVLIEPVRDAWDDVRTCLRAEQPFVIATRLAPLTALRRTTQDLAAEDDKASGLRRLEMGGEVFVDRLLPPPRLVIIGAGDDARPLARLADATGFRVAVVDRRPGLLLRDRFPGAFPLLDRMPDAAALVPLIDADTFVVLMTHNFADDQAYLAAVLPSSAGYIGVLGPRQRTDRMTDALGASGDARIFGPIGLDIGGEGADQVAVAILAELLAVAAGRNGGSLRARVQPIHGPHD